jgi:hypothetical protein
VEVDRVAPKVSYGHVIQQDVNLAKGFVPGSYILREKTNVKKVASSGEKTGKKGGGFKKEKNNDDW